MTGKVPKNSDLLMMSLSSFYAQKGTMQKVLPIINGKSKYSLRLIDWFVTNYAKNNNTIITYKSSDNNVVHFNVYLSYRSQLKAYSKQQFDPFRRRERILFYYEKDKSVETTIGQLNFFRWILQNHLLDFIVENYKAVEKDMIAQNKNANSESHNDNDASNDANDAAAENQPSIAKSSGKSAAPKSTPTPASPGPPSPGTQTPTLKKGIASNNTSVTSSTHERQAGKPSVPSVHGPSEKCDDTLATSAPKAAAPKLLAMHKLNCIPMSRSIRFD